MKNYMKPAISFQVLNLATEVSGGCNTGTEHDPYKCPVELPGWGGETIFTTTGTCTWITQDPEEFDVCYHGPSGIVSVLGS